MENNSGKQAGFYSEKLKAGKRRTYFFDVRSTKQGDFFVTITESKKKIDSDGYESHKIFLYKEDFNKFIEGLEDVISFIKKEQGEAVPREYPVSTDSDIVESASDDEVAGEPEVKKSFFDKFKF